MGFVKGALYRCVSSVTLQRGANEQTPRLCPINNGGEKDASQDPPASKQPGSRPDFHKTLPLIQSGLQLKLDHSDDKAVCGIKWCCWTDFLIKFCCILAPLSNSIVKINFKQKIWLFHIENTNSVPPGTIFWVSLLRLIAFFILSEY